MAYVVPRRTCAASERPVRGQTASYAEWGAGLGGGSSEEAIRIGRPCSISGTAPATVEINGTVGGSLIDAVTRAQGSSHIKAQPSKAMAMGPVTAHTSNATRMNPRRHDIVWMIAPTRGTGRLGRCACGESIKHQGRAFARRTLACRSRRGRSVGAESLGLRREALRDGSG